MEGPSPLRREVARPSERGGGLSVARRHRPGPGGAALRPPAARAPHRGPRPPASPPPPPGGAAPPPPGGPPVPRRPRLRERWQQRRPSQVPAPFPPKARDPGDQLGWEAPTRPSPRCWGWMVCVFFFRDRGVRPTVARGLCWSVGRTCLRGRGRVPGPDAPVRRPTRGVRPAGTLTPHLPSASNPPPHGIPPDGRHWRRSSTRPRRGPRGAPGPSDPFAAPTPRSRPPDASV